MTSENLTESQVVCPHCWHRFYSDHAHYISRHPELMYGDSVLKDGEHRRFAPNAVTIDPDRNALDSKGWKMLERACPTCHMQIPPDLLARRPFFVSVVGAPRSGKTYFLTSMVHELRKDLARYFGFSLQDSDSHDVRAFLEYERELFFPSDPNQPTLLKKTQEQGELYNVVRLDGADVQLPKPFIFALNPIDSNLGGGGGKHMRQNVVLYDNAGESFDLLKDRDSRNRSTHHLAECDCVLFAFDPLQDPDARQRLASVSQDPQLSKAASTFRQETILQEVIHRIRRHRGFRPDKRIDGNLGICVQKYDVWKSLVPFATMRDPEFGERSLIDHTSIEFIKERGVAGLDVEEINSISLLIRSFVENLCPEFCALAESNFRDVRYFPISALGTSPEYGVGHAGVADMLRVRPCNLQPFRVTHPMLWLLYKWGLIKRIKPRADRAGRYPHARIDAVGEDRIRVISPGTGQSIALDREYAGSSNIDPTSGAMIWIPEIAPAPATATPASSPSTPSLKLQMAPEPPKPKKGWFRK